MKIKLLFITLLFSCLGISQTTIYTENFTNQLNKGATYNAATGLTEIDLSGVTWSIDVSAISLNETSDWFKVNDDTEFIEGRDLDGTAIWFSPIIDISNFTNIQFSIDASESSPTEDNLENNDTFITEFSLDGGLWTLAGNNGSIQNDFVDTAVSHNTFLNGSTLELRVSISTNANDERIRLDTIIIEGIAPTSPTIIINPNSNSVTGLTNVEGNVPLTYETFTVQGSALTNDITLNAPANFLISDTFNGPYQPSITLIPTAGEVFTSTIYTQLNFSAVVGTHNEIINISSTGAPTKTVGVSGEVFPYIPSGDCTELFISEYHEAATGTPNEQYLELYNPTNTSIDLTNYQLARFKNGLTNTPPLIRTLNGNIAPYTTYLIARNNSILCGSGTPDYCTGSSVMNFDGNDVITLQNSAGINIDTVGDLGVNNMFGQNVDLARNTNIQTPTTTYSPSDWTSSPSNNTTNLGYYFNDCQCSGITIWDGLNWSITPDSNTSAILNANYTTGIAGQPSFSACRLTISSGVSLTIQDNTSVKINNVVINKGSLVIHNKGSFVQENNSAPFINNTSSASPVMVHKRTAPVNYWYEYTYWSSPVPEETLETFLPDTSPSRKFKFNGSAFADVYAETLNNNDTSTLGQDDVDDDGNDWEYASGFMIPGKGYAATLSPIDLTGPSGGTNGILKTFKGNTLNTGTIGIPVNRNDTITEDNNWNLIGNPYPSAIDINLFFAENQYGLGPNGVLEGAIYYWSQNAPPSSTNNGNQVLNFDTMDYAIYNGSGAHIAGELHPSSVQYIPNDYIPSGQAFFVLYDDDAASNNGNVIFRNSMRVPENNEQFYRAHSTNQANRLWLNLSNTTIFSQTAIAYIDNATNGDDGAIYDAPRYFNGSSAMLVSFAENSNKPLAIQGKQTNALNLNEVISLGFTTAIDSLTSYTIGIDHFEGAFLTANAIYLRDNELNIFHDLTTESYTFNSEKGQFNTRFEVVFTQPSLATESFIVSENFLIIFEDRNNETTFKVANNHNIDSVKIYDVYGRLLYDLKGVNNSETYHLSQVNSAAYIAKVTLRNGQIITKKALKK
ncbi:T9SS sorting signal type C domain-containing protein [Bizionia saleffrena]|uniref:T9SS sorting signal type C domain-containing protein n=1 Tax=Bizionia saleffrena TaxID=291189 RepID=A0A8H2LEV7_9FLAO|nr:lamin tail domain-containing protein [Bizionia saleffrena]TYB75977.1 T9SS sorting signal type C domain-containing protein [Bizionia saleffrena]